MGDELQSIVFNRCGHLFDRFRAAESTLGDPEDNSLITSTIAIRAFIADQNVPGPAEQESNDDCEQVSGLRDIVSCFPCLGMFDRCDSITACTTLMTKRENFIVGPDP